MLLLLPSSHSRCDGLHMPLLSLPHSLLSRRRHLVGHRLWALNRVRGTRRCPTKKHLRMAGQGLTYRRSIPREQIYNSAFSSSDASCTSTFCPSLKWTHIACGQIRTASRSSAIFLFFFVFPIRSLPLRDWGVSFRLQFKHVGGFRVALCPHLRLVSFLVPHTPLLA